MANLPVGNLETDHPCPRNGARAPRIFVRVHYQCQSCDSKIKGGRRGKAWEGKV